MALFGNDDYDLRCELHEIEPGIIFSLTNRNGMNGFIVDKYPVAPFNNLYYEINNNNNNKRNRNNKRNIINIISEQISDIKNNNNNKKDNDNDNDNDNDDSRNLMINNQALYVNRKQYYRILRRREIRTALRNKLIRENKIQTVYKNDNGKTIKHKSRHKHAKRRLRGPHGQFLSKEAMAKLNKQQKS